MNGDDYFSDYAERYEKAKERAENEAKKKENYLEEYMSDRYADLRGLTPIVFDMSRICKVTPLEEVYDWPESPMGRKAKKMGMTVHKYIVSCPNPRHSMFTTLLPDLPHEWSYRCPHCISEEIARIDILRFRRDQEERRRS